MADLNLFSPARLGPLELPNRVVMAPLTRCRAHGNVPNELMVEYYRQRAGAGLIISEGTSPSPNGVGYPRMPGIWSREQVTAWSKITKVLHDGGSKAFMQVMHCGRMAIAENLPAGARVLAPSAVPANAMMRTADDRKVNLPVPEEMTAADVAHAIGEYVTAAVNAREAGFDGVELHGANGYLIEQFISPQTNQRSDRYGGSIANRCRFVLEVAEAVAAAIGADRTGIRLSPYGVASDMRPYPEVDETYAYLAEALDKMGIIYIHTVDNSSRGAPPVPMAMKETIRATFGKTVIISGGYSRERADADLQSGLGTLVAFGRPFINNPDLVERLRHGWPLSSDLKEEYYYTADEVGYTDYPAYSTENVS
jgi:N-ethylmaleimide reductase